MFFRRMVLWIIFLGVIGTLDLVIAARTGPEIPITLKNQQNYYEVGPFLEMLEDKAGQLTIEDLTGGSHSHEFVKVNSESLALGLTESVFWFRFSVLNESNDDIKRFFRINRCDLEDCKLYFPKHAFLYGNDGKTWQELDWNQQNKGQKANPICNQINFTLPPLSKIPTTFYLRIHHPIGTVYLDLSIVNEDALKKTIKTRSLWLGVYYGTLLAMLIFNLHLYVALRENKRLLYILYIIAVFLYFLGLNDIFFEYFTDKKLHGQLTVSAMGLVIIWGTAFAKSFLNTKKNTKFFNILIISIILSTLGILVVTPFVSEMFLNQAYSLLGTLVPFIVMGAGITCWFKGFRPILFFLIAWTFLLLGGLIFVLTFRGLLPYSPLTMNSLQIGSGFEVVILSFALGQRIRALQYERDSIRQIFGKYVSNKVCDEILDEKVSLDGETKEVTVLISDLRDYTPLVESMPPKELVRITNIYFGAMAESIKQHKGVIIRYVGDSIQAAFGAPLPVDRHPEMAVKAAIEMRRQLNRVNRKLMAEGFNKLKHGIGIDTGVVTAGSIGGADRLSYSLSGITVNLASRIQDLNKKYGTDILVSATTMSQVRDEIKCENMGKIEIRGLKKPVEIFSVL